MHRCNMYSFRNVLESLFMFVNPVSVAENLEMALHGRRIRCLYVPAFAPKGPYKSLNVTDLIKIPWLGCSPLH